MANPHEIIGHPWFKQRSAEYYRWYPKSLASAPQSTGWQRGSECAIEGLYVHVPFCDEICSFCPFNKRVTTGADIERYVEALIQELALLADSVPSKPLHFIYFGGGSPSVLTPLQLERLVATISQRFSVRADLELTLEIHPRNCIPEYLGAIRAVGFNRVSAGIQSLNERILQRTGATHARAASISAIQTMESTFANWGVDLLYRCPGQSLVEWQNDVAELLSLASPPHISCYTLALPDDSQQPSAVDDVAMACHVNDRLGASGYQHYASCATGGFDFCKPGHHCNYEVRHWGAPQTAYWGVGAGAIGYSHGRTVVNLHDVARYCSALASSRLPISVTSHPSDDELMRRYFCLGVKTLAVPLEPFKAAFGPLTDPLKEAIRELESIGMLSSTATELSVTPIGRYYVDQVSAAFWSSAEADVPHPETNSLRLLDQIASSRSARVQIE